MVITETQLPLPVVAAEVPPLPVLVGEGIGALAVIGIIGYGIVRPIREAWKAAHLNKTRRTLPPRG